MSRAVAVIFVFCLEGGVLAASWSRIRRDFLFLEWHELMPPLPPLEQVPSHCQTVNPVVLNL